MGALLPEIMKGLVRHMLWSGTSWRPLIRSSYGMEHNVVGVNRNVDRYTSELIRIMSHQRRNGDIENLGTQQASPAGRFDTLDEAG